MLNKNKIHLLVLAVPALAVCFVIAPKAQASCLQSDNCVLRDTVGTNDVHLYLCGGSVENHTIHCCLQATGVPGVASNCTGDNTAPTTNRTVRWPSNYNPGDSDRCVYAGVITDPGGP